MKSNYPLRHEPSGLPMVNDGNDVWRVLGTLPPNKKCKFQNFGDVFTVIPESQWEEYEPEDWFSQVTVYNQGQYGSCTGHGSVAAFTFSWLLSGQPARVFSPTSVYAHINNGVDQGAQVSDALTALEQYGTCLQSQFGENEIFMSQMPAAAQQTALRFRVGTAYKINSWDELGTAITQGLVVVSGLAVGQNFSNLDSNGVVPLPDTVIGGHCMASYGLKQINGVWVVKTRNSWGTSWGLNGDCYLQQGIYDPQYGFPFDAFAIGGVIDDPQSPDDPPVLTT